MKKMKFYLFFCIALNLACRGFAQNIDVPNKEMTSNSTENLFTSSTESTSNSAENTTTTQALCPENMIPVAANPLIDNWTCACYRPFVFVDKLCIELFRQRPCKPGKFIVRPATKERGRPEFECVENPCVEDGLVPNNGTCVSATTVPLCLQGRVWYIEETKKIECIADITYNLFSWAARGQCPSGFRKDKNGICRKKI